MNVIRFIQYYVRHIASTLEQYPAVEKLKLLLWKNFLLQRRHKMQTVFEMLSPVIFACFIVFIRCIVEPKYKEGTDYPPFLPTLNPHKRSDGEKSEATSKYTIAFSPGTELTGQVVTMAMTKLAMQMSGKMLFDPNNPIEPKIFNNSRQMEAALTKFDAMEYIFAGIQFDDKMADAVEWPKDIKVTLRFPAIMRMPILDHPIHTCWRTNILFPIYAKPGPREPDDAYGGIRPGIFGPGDSWYTILTVYCAQFCLSLAIVIRLQRTLSHSISHLRVGLRNPRNKIHTIYFLEDYLRKPCFTGCSVEKFVTKEFNEQVKVYLMLNFRWCLFAGYVYEMFVALQHVLSQAIIEAKSGESYNSNVYLQRMPSLGFRQDNLLAALERFISMIIMLSFAYAFINTVRSITQEKELQLKETMKIMGVPSWLHWLSWTIKQLTYLSVSVVALAIMLKIPFKKMENGDGFAVLTYTPISLLIFFLMLYVIVSLAFCFMISTFFNKANTAASFTGLVWFVTYSFYMLTQGVYEQITLTTKIMLSFLSNSAMGFAFQLIVTAEAIEGLQWDKFFSTMSYDDKLTPAHCAAMMIIDTILYMLIAVYMEKIKPGTYGVPLPWYFPFTKSFWKPAKIQKHMRAITYESDEKQYDESFSRIVHDDEPIGIPLGVDIRNLTKVYRKKKKVVDNLSFRMYENEITVLLGHNGAGKTTTISMMTGMVPPTSGTAYINGRDIVTETEEARKSIGICPQHNVLFPDLTVAEHIKFYGRIKGVPKDNIDEEVDNYLRLLDLKAKRNVQSQHLSGGQQRRLSVGIAMCGSSRVVLLDEPTSGLDPSARRALWDLLQKEKKGRTMILTTHFMDEADVLADRIAIMAAGRLQCIGTPYFLKKHYGIGYKLTIVKQDSCSVDECTTFMKNYVSNVSVNTDIGSELTYILATTYVNIFPEMLKALEENKSTLKIDSYGLSITTLEEVFMSTGAETYTRRLSDSRKPTSRQTLSTTSLRYSHISSIRKVHGVRLLRNHIRAMFLKLAYSATRNTIQNVIQLVAPFINITTTVLVARSWKFLSSLDPLVLNLTPYRRTETLLSHEPDLPDPQNKIMKAYKKYFAQSRKKDMILNDIGAKSISDYYKKLLKTKMETTRFETTVGVSFNPDNITAWFSNYGYHDVPISLGLVNSAILDAMSPGATLTFINHPLPFSITNQIRMLAAGADISFSFAFNIAFCLGFVSSFIVLFVIKERVSGAKLLQRVSGVRPIVMWGCAYVWDWFWMLLIHIIIILTLAYYQEYTLSTFDELGRVLLVLLIFTIAIVPIQYVLSFYFDSAATGFAKMCFFNIFSGCVPFLVSEVLQIEALGSKHFVTTFDTIFSPLPLYCASRCFRDMSVTSFSLSACHSLCDQYKDTIGNCTAQKICKRLKITACCIEEDPYFNWDEPGISRYLVIMSLLGVSMFALLLVKEYGLLSKVLYLIVSRKPVPASILRDDTRNTEDSDVTAERQHVQSMGRRELIAHSLVVSDLTKVYDTLLAVNRISFAVRRGECFGLLGVNGAGKTTTFKMLTGDTRISHGDALVLGYSIKTEHEEVHRRIGYCPQFDGLLDNLTGRETLRIYCLLRGIPSMVGKESAMQLARSLGFLRHFDKMVCEYSGGTKRKLSTALALMGDAPLVYLDEPTTGMDPASKRLVWSCVSETAVLGRSVVLTSHSMEECEALCTKLTIMVNGRLHCIGTLQHLKNKYSQGYTLIVKCKTGADGEDTIELINEYILKIFKNSKLLDTYLGISTYYVGDEDVAWWQIFDAMENAKKQYPEIDDYSVTQTTLEQVFLCFMQHQGQRIPLPKQSRKQEIIMKIKQRLNRD